MAGLGSVTFTSIHLDATALLFTLGVAVVVGLLFGLAPAFRATRASVAETLKDAGADSGRHGRLNGRRLLVVVEVALALVLLIGSGLMIRSLANLLSRSPGLRCGPCAHGAVDGAARQRDAGFAARGL